LSGGGEMKIIGMISGTSFDGIDVALCDFEENDGLISIKVEKFESHKYSKELHELIAQSMPPQSIDMERVCILDTKIGQAFAEAAAKFSDEAELIVSHGQTLFHWISDNKALGTLQLGEPTWIAQRTGTPVLSNIRSRDVAAGGHGAPLVSIIDQMMLGDYEKPVGALNLGGISNITITGRGLTPIAYDIGPANGLLDTAIAAFTQGRTTFDEDAKIALSGVVDQDRLRSLLQEPYYKLPAPKSTGKELFHLPYLLKFFGPVSEWKIEDLMRTLVELTVETVALEVEKFQLGNLYIHGGGSKNPLMMKRLQERLSNCLVQPISVLGLDPREKEAVAFALMGFLSWHGVPGSLSSCTGSKSEEILGSLTPGKNPLELPRAKARRNYKVEILS